MGSHGRYVCFVYLLCIGFSKADNNPCRAKDFGEDSVVCECDENYCDTYQPSTPERGQVVIVTTNKDGLRFSETIVAITNSSEVTDYGCNEIIEGKTVVIRLNQNISYQEIHGFGGGFTDAAGFNIAQLPQAAQDLLMNSYFSSEGLDYNMGRIPIGHSDFSFSPYYYDETDYDVNMTDWKLNDADIKYKIPYIKRAKEIAKEQIHLVASVWTVPEWMREYDMYGQKSTVIEKYYDAYTLNIIKYLQAYQENGIDHWAVTYANEPCKDAVSVTSDEDSLMTTVWAVNKLEEFATEYFTPALKDNGFNDTKLMFLDDIPFSALTFWLNRLNDTSKIKKVVDVIAFHPIYAEYVSRELIDVVHETFPNAIIINSESSLGITEGVKLGRWDRAADYANCYIEDLNHFIGGWIDWNLALDKISQPSFFKTKLDASIIVDNDGYKKFYKQPVYYAIGHFSKFFTRGSKRIVAKSLFPTNVGFGAVARPDGLSAVVLFNPSNETVDAILMDECKGNIRVNLSPNSINTLLY